MRTRVIPRKEFIASRCAGFVFGVIIHSCQAINLRSYHECINGLDNRKWYEALFPSIISSRIIHQPDPIIPTEPSQHGNMRHHRALSVVSYVTRYMTYYVNSPNFRHSNTGKCTIGVHHGALFVSNDRIDISSFIRHRVGPSVTCIKYVCLSAEIFGLLFLAL